MPHGLFTRHAKPRFVAIHQDLLDICDGQHCEAALLHEIEYICSVYGVIFRLSLEELSATILGLYSRDRVRKALSWLESRKFIEPADTINKGELKPWRLNVSKVDSALYSDAPPVPNTPSENQRVPHRKTNGGSLENQRGVVGKPTGPSLVGVKDSKDLKDSPLPPKGGEAEIVSFLQDQAIKHGVKVRFTGKQKDWLRENEPVRIQVLALTVMVTHRGRRINVTDEIMAAAGYSSRNYGGPASATQRGPGPGHRRQFTPRDPKPKGNPGVIAFEAKLLAEGKISQEEWERLRAQD